MHGLRFLKNGESEYIDPYTKDGVSYTIYAKKDVEPADKILECKVKEGPSKLLSGKKSTHSKSLVNDGKLRTFRLALGCTGEYAQFHLTDQEIPAAATEAVKKAAVLAAMNVTMTRVNALFERDLSLTMKIVSNNTNVIFLDSGTDGLSNGDGTAMIAEYQAICDTNIGTANYDIGHVFGVGNSGLAELSSPCTNKKAQGVTGSTSPKGDTFDIDFVIHEMGHQFGATHTFNNSCNENRTGFTAVEPGSGSTIMAYAGICAPNVQGNSDAYFHGVSIEQMYANITSGNSDCGGITVTGNTAPTVNAGNDYTVPSATSFVLKGEATDTEGGLTYCWEQIDSQTATMPPVGTNVGGPLFRSLPPSSSSERYFPKLGTVLNGQSGTIWEQLPTVTRSMNFKLTVRDNNISGGQVGLDDVKLSVDGNSGPFVITSQNTSEIFRVGESKTIVWDVANTNVLPVNASEVNILLSVDGGLTFPVVLASNVTNDGSHAIVVPSNITNQGRIKVEASNNVFYSINKTNIQIDDSKFVMTLAENPLAVCAPANAVYSFTYNSFLGFSNETIFSVSGLPAGTNAVFSPSSAVTNGTVVEMKIEGITEAVQGLRNFILTGTSGAEIRNVNVGLEVFKGNIEKPVLTAPVNNIINTVSPVTFEWTESENIVLYTLEISDDTGFTNIVKQAELKNSGYVLEDVLESGKQYYWRIKGMNSCEESEYSDVFTFTMGILADFNYNSTGGQVAIPDNNSSGISSIIRVNEVINITSVKAAININHSYIGDLRVVLISPEGIEVVLVRSSDDNGINYVQTTFDDAASLRLLNSNAPYTGSFKPEEVLSVLNSEMSLGDWTLKVVDTADEDTGSLISWILSISGVKINENDVDNDGVNNDVDNCPLNANPLQEDQDGDGFGDVCDDDIDGDGVNNTVDNCITTANSSQEDKDNDGIGDVCDDDIDGDGVNNDVDNCPFTANPEQEDIDGDGIGDVCDLDLIIEIPEGFTPNSDGTNDLWIVKNINDGNSENAEYSFANVKIYNRAGELVYESDHYKNDWDGVGLDGVKVPIGIYVYRIYSDGDAFALKSSWLYIKY